MAFGEVEVLLFDKPLDKDLRYIRPRNDRSVSFSAGNRPSFDDAKRSTCMIEINLKPLKKPTVKSTVIDDNILHLEIEHDG